MFFLMQHFNELKIKFFYISFSFLTTFFICYTNILYLINLISKPLISKIKADFIFTSVFEVFNTYIMLSVYLSFFLSIPVIMYFTYIFLKSGLFEFEKKIFKKFIYIFNINLILSSFLSYFVFFPMFLYFLLNFDIIINLRFVILKMEPKLFDYIYIVCNFFILYGFFLFQIPTIFYLLVSFFGFKNNFFYKNRRFLIILSLFVGCFFSSPDLISLFLIVIPLFIFFEILIFLSILYSHYNN